MPNPISPPWLPLLLPQGPLHLPQTCQKQSTSGPLHMLSPLPEAPFLSSSWPLLKCQLPENCSSPTSPISPICLFHQLASETSWSMYVFTP